MNHFISGIALNKRFDAMDYDSWHLLHRILKQTYPDSDVNGAIMGPTWGRQDPVELHVAPRNLATWVVTVVTTSNCLYAILERLVFWNCCVITCVICRFICIAECMLHYMYGIYLILISEHNKAEILSVSLLVVGRRPKRRRNTFYLTLSISSIWHVVFIWFLQTHFI